MDDAQQKHEELVRLLNQIGDTLQHISENMVTLADMYEPPEPDCYD
jgi:hypothetical protein